MKARLGLIDLRMRLESQSEHAAPGLVQKAHAHVLKSLASEIAKLEAAICAKIKSTPDFAERAEIIESVPGFAETSSANLVAGMPELGQVSDEIAAALIGVAPYDDDSGKRRGERHIKGGRRWVRNAIYMPCVGAATQNNPVLKAYYRRLIAKGKRAKGRARRLHAQADRHPQHHDRTAAEMGSQPPRVELTERSPPRSVPPTERLQSQQTGERAGSRPQPPQAGARQRQP